MRRAVVAPAVGSAVLALLVVTVALKNVYERVVSLVAPCFRIPTSNKGQREPPLRSRHFQAEEHKDILTRLGGSTTTCPQPKVIVMMSCQHIAWWVDRRQEESRQVQARRRRTLHLRRQTGGCRARREVGERGVGEDKRENDGQREGPGVYVHRRGMNCVASPLHHHHLSDRPAPLISLRARDQYLMLQKSCNTRAQMGFYSCEDHS
jgi:hypothetical protein